jgi:hypothetical protein
VSSHHHTCSHLCVLRVDSLRVSRLLGLFLLLLLFRSFGFIIDCSCPVVASVLFSISENPVSFCFPSSGALLQQTLELKDRLNVLIASATKQRSKSRRIPSLHVNGTRTSKLTHQALTTGDTGYNAAGSHTLQDVLAVPGYQVAVINYVFFAIEELDRIRVSYEIRILGGKEGMEGGIRLSSKQRRTCSSTRFPCRRFCTQTFLRRRT